MSRPASMPAAATEWAAEPVVDRQVIGERFCFFNGRTATRLLPVFREHVETMRRRLERPVSGPNPVGRPDTGVGRTSVTPTAGTGYGPVPTGRTRSLPEQREH